MELCGIFWSVETEDNLSMYRVEEEDGGVWSGETVGSLKMCKK